MIRNYIDFAVQRRRALTGGASMLVIGFANIGIGIIVTIILARLLLPAEYGSYLLAFGLANILSMPIELGLPTLLMREIARYRAKNAPEHVTAIIGWTVLFLVSSFAIVFVALLAYIEFAPRSTKLGPALEMWTVALLLPLALMNCARGVLLGYEKPILFALPDSVFRPALLLIFVALLATVSTVTSAMTMACHVAAVFLCFLWSANRAYVTLRQNNVALRLRTADFEVRAWISSLLPLTLTNGIQLISRRIDIVMIGILGTTVAVAGYNVATQITSTILIAQTVLNSVIGSKIAFAFELDDKDRLRRLLAGATAISSIFAIGTLLAIVVLGQFAIHLVFGPAYASSYFVALILCVGQIFSGLMGPTTLLLNMTRHERANLNTGILAAVLNITLNALLVPHFLEIGAAISGSVTLVAIQTQRWWMVRKHTGIRTDVFAAFGYWRKNLSRAA